MSRLVAVVAFCSVVTTFAADVDKTVAQKDGWAAYAGEINKKADEVNAKCGGMAQST